MNALWFVITVFSVWRIAHLFALEDGPFKLLARLRAFLGAGFWGSLMDCFYCLSVWVALPFAAALGGSLKERALLWPALSGAAILVNRLADSWDRPPAAMQVEYFEARLPQAPAASQSIVQEDL